MATDLLTSIIEGGIRSPNFFNGRLLSGEDLNLEKTANRDARRRLGKAVGDGVAYGLEVSETPVVSTHSRPVVTVMPGLAVNRRGQTLMLSSRTDVVLVRSLETESVEGRAFADCDLPTPGEYVAGAGVYLLAICPASVKEGRAPVSGLGNTAASCNAKTIVECLKFRLVKLDVSDDILGDTAHLRNRLAYSCFGSDDTDFSDNFLNPFGLHGTGYGLLDDMRPDLLTDCDVPLALLYWTSTGGIQFIDMWGVRRRVVSPYPFGGWMSLAGARRASEAEAMVLQFHDQISGLVQATVNAASLQASAYFEFLPPVGVIPLDAGLRGRGVNPITFFNGLTVKGVFSTAGAVVPARGRSIREGIFIEAARMGELIFDALHYPPIDIRSKELVWLYVVRENMQSIEKKKYPAPVPFAIFVNGQTQYRGNARFDVNRWSYGNYV